MSNWPQRPCTDPYYDIVEHLFRAPDLIESPNLADRSPRAHRAWRRRRWTQRTALLRHQPAPLDQLLGVFVALASPPLVSEIVEAATGWPCMGPFRLLSESVWRRFGRDEANRPEVVFVAPEAVFVMELKASGRKAGREQIASDALLVQQIHDSLAPKRCSVVHLTSARFGERAAPDDAGAARQAAIRHLPQMRQDGLHRLGANGRVILADTISAFELTAMSFTQLDHVLGGYASASAPAATEARLIDGLRRELRFRGLADAPYLASDMALLAA